MLASSWFIIGIIVGWIFANFDFDIESYDDEEDDKNETFPKEERRKDHKD